MALTNAAHSPRADTWLYGFMRDLQGGFMKQDECKEMCKKFHYMFGGCYFCIDEYFDRATGISVKEGLPDYCQQRIKMEFLKK